MLTPLTFERQKQSQAWQVKQNGIQSLSYKLAVVEGTLNSRQIWDVCEDPKSHRRLKRRRRCSCYSQRSCYWFAKVPPMMNTFLIPGAFRFNYCPKIYKVKTSETSISVPPTVMTLFATMRKCNLDFRIGKSCFTQILNLSIQRSPNDLSNDSTNTQHCSRLRRKSHCFVHYPSEAYVSETRTTIWLYSINP